MNAFAAGSYGLAATLYLILAALLLTSWKGRRPGIRLAIACIVEAAWAALIAAHPYSPTGELPLVVYLAEFARQAAWLATLAGLLAMSGFPRLIAVAAYVVCGGFAIAGVLATWLGVATGFELDLATLLSKGGLAASVIGFLMLEQIYRNSTARGRSAFKYLFIGLGGLFAYDLFLFAWAEMFGSVNARLWALRGLINAMLLPAIVVAVRRNPQWSVELFVSRQVVFYSATLMAVGAYLLAMAIGGYYLREYIEHVQHAEQDLQQFDRSWGAILQGVFFAGALIALAAALLSSALRRRLRVFISKHFYRNKYDYRAEWLRFIATLSADEASPDIRRTAIQAVAQIFGSRAGSLFTLDDARRRFIPVAHWPDDFVGYGDGTGIEADSGLGQFLRQRKWIVELGEYRHSPDLYGDLVLPPWLAEDSGAGIVAPIEFRDEVTGFVVLEAPPPPFSLNYEDRDVLKTVGQHLATHLAQYEADRRLTEARQFEAYNRLTAFMMHDLKNAVAQLHLLVANAARHKNNPEFVEDAIETVSNCAQRMSRLIEQLRSGETPPAHRQVQIAPLVTQAVERCSMRRPVPQLHCDAEGLCVDCDPERLTSTVEHVIRNAQDATPEAGRVEVAVEPSRRGVVIRISDNGSGMSPDFVHERLFRPFDSTKGSKGMGIGAYQVREYARQLGGEVEVDSEPGSGTRFSIFLPRCDAQQDTG
jgi:putative PEP-CTERM system histidine kinase